MKAVTALVIAAGLAASASAQVTYDDTTGELFDNDFDHLDIDSVEVDHDDTYLYFTVNLRGDLDDPAWGKYCIGISTDEAIDDTTNGWGRNISWSGQTIDYWIGTWADDGGNNFGGEIRQMTGNDDFSNNLLAATYNGNPEISGTSEGFAQVIVLDRAILGLSGDQTFYFDVITTGGGGGDPGVDHASNPDMATPGWGDQSVAGEFFYYTIPAPASAGLLTLGALAATRRRR